MKHSIELDCPPGSPRPFDLIEGVLKDTGLEVKDFETSPPFFGNQEWSLKEASNKEDVFLAARPTLKERVEKLYNTGFIRYGSW